MANHLQKFKGQVFDGPGDDSRRLHGVLPRIPETGLFYFQLDGFHPVKAKPLKEKPLVEPFGVTAPVIVAGRMGDEGGHPLAGQMGLKGFGRLFSCSKAVLVIPGFGIPALAKGDQCMEGFRRFVKQIQIHMLLCPGQGKMGEDTVDPEHKCLFIPGDNIPDGLDIPGDFTGMVDPVKIKEIVFRIFFDLALGLKESMVDNGGAAKLLMDLLCNEPGPDIVFMGAVNNRAVGGHHKDVGGSFKYPYSIGYRVHLLLLLYRFERPATITAWWLQN